MQVTAKSLVNKVGGLKRPFVCTKVEKLEVPNRGTPGYYDYQEIKDFKQEKVILTSVYYVGYNDYVGIKYIENNKTEVKYIPKDFKFDVLKGVEKEDMIREYEKYMLHNLQTQLHYSLTIGCDPEVFAEDENGKLVPAFNFLKKTPLQVTRGSKVFWDGYQAEFTTCNTGCLDFQSQNIQAGLKGIHDELKKHNPNAKLSARTVAYLDFNELETAKDEHVEFGCDESHNAYGMQGIVLGPREVPYRTAGGHLHFGFKNWNPVPTKKEIETIVKALDAIVAVACVSLFAKIDDPMRRQMYGLAGEYRLPSHGLEYRVLSNAWAFHPLTTHLVFDLARRTIAFARRDLLKYWQYDEKEVIEIINKCDVKKARKLLRKNKGIFTKILQSYCGDARAADMIYNIYLSGVEKVIKNPTDIEGNWNLKKDGGWSYSQKGVRWRNSKDEISKGKKV